MSLVITDAGIAASIRAGDLGIEYKITHISIGTEGYIPSKSQVALKNEVLRKALTKSSLTGIGKLHFETMWDGKEEFEGKELGYWLDDGTLFAVDSRNGVVITYKRKDTVVTEACELNLSGSSIENITVELTDATYATEEFAGIAKIATVEKVAQGTDDLAFLTIKKLLQRTASTLRLGVVQLSNSLTGTSQSKAATEKAVGDVHRSLESLKQSDNPFPSYWHNNEAASQAEAIAGTSHSRIMTALRSMEQLKSRISGSVSGTRTDYAASESALKRAYDLAASKANEAHMHSASDINTGVLAKERLPDATTAGKGAVQLNNTLTSTSTSQALTANQGRILNEKMAQIEPSVGLPMQVDNIDGMKYNPYTASIAQLKDGRIVVWGTQHNNTTLATFGCGLCVNTISGFSVVPLPRLVWKQYGAFGHVGFALAESGELYTWGGNSTLTTGQAAPHWSNLPKFVRGGVEEVISSKFSSGGIEYAHVVLIMKNKTFMYFGANNHGQSQNGNTSPVKEPINWPAPPGQSHSTLKELVSIGNNYNWIVWIGNNGRHYAIGTNHHRQFGIGVTAAAMPWTELTWLRGKSVSKVVGGSTYNAGQSGDQWMAVLSGGSAYFTGHNSLGQFGSQMGYHATPKIEANIDDLFCFGGGAPTVIKKYQSKYYARGHSSEGQTGKLQEVQPDWNVVSHFDVSVFATTHGHTHSFRSNAFFVYREASIDRLFVIGANSYGSAGLGYVGNRPLEGAALEVVHPFTSRIKNIESGGFDDGGYTLILLENGELWGAGYGARYNISGLYSGHRSADSHPTFKRLF
ncbi:tail fiber protein [Vibrio scophthalmi]|uniref:Uncharacterized protein n=1 Tax=Vibrio scophthalmi TaxID=45658 RepID=A0A1C7FB90_9VIBR|nr:tail fiber protein [Vibrio scophthalmi]ANU36279.1 hypothetical protein VSVS05_01152 [Vibrio scophthalmi]